MEWLGGLISARDDGLIYGLLSSCHENIFKRTGKSFKNYLQNQALIAVQHESRKPTCMWEMNSLVLSCFWICVWQASRENHMQRQTGKNIYFWYRSWQLSSCSTAGRLALPYLRTEKIKSTIGVIADTTLHISPPCISCFPLSAPWTVYGNVLSICTAKSTEAEPKRKPPFNTRSFKARRVDPKPPQTTLNWSLAITHKRMPPLPACQRLLKAHNSKETAAPRQSRLPRAMCTEMSLVIETNLRH